jgi:hypothetical protein
MDVVTLMAFRVDDVTLLIMISMSISTENKTAWVYIMIDRMFRPLWNLPIPFDGKSPRTDILIFHAKRREASGCKLIYVMLDESSLSLCWR